MLAVGALLGCLHCSLWSFSCVLGMSFKTSNGLQHSIFELGFVTHMSIPSLGKEEEIVTISPRTLFVSKKGYSFLAAGKIVCIIILIHINVCSSVISYFRLLWMTLYFTRLSHLLVSMNIVILCILLSALWKWMICKPCQ